MPYCPNCGTEYELGAVRCPDCNAALVETPPVTPERDPEAGEQTVVVYTTEDDSDAAMVSELLTNAGIRNLTANETIHGVIPVTMGSLATIRIQVLEHDVESAKRILTELRDRATE